MSEMYRGEKPPEHKPTHAVDDVDCHFYVTGVDDIAESKNPSLLFTSRQSIR